MQGFGKTMIVFGVCIAVMGVFIHFGWHRYIPLGRLPGDVHFQNGKSSFYFPVTTCILISVVLSVLSYFFKK